MDFPKLPFEETWLVSLAERPDRYNTMRERIDKLGWDVKDFRVVMHPSSDFIAKKLGSDLGGIGFSIQNGNIFNCAREQYTIVKSAYLRGVETLAILEDDASFLNSPVAWEEYLNNLPADWDILRFNTLRGKDVEIYCQSRPTEKYWVKQPMYNMVFGAAFYVMNRKGMKYLIDSTDKIFQPLDNALAFLNDDNINMYIPRYPLSIVFEDGYISNLRENADQYGPQLLFKELNLNRDLYI